MCTAVCVCLCVYTRTLLHGVLRSSRRVHACMSLALNLGPAVSSQSAAASKQNKQRKRQITIRTAKQEARQSRKGTAPSAKTDKRDRQTETERQTDRQTETQRELRMFYCRMFTVPLSPQRSQGLLGTGTPGWPPLLSHSSA